MKKYRIRYCNYTDATVFCFVVTAECQQDAIDYFFYNYSGTLLGVDFIGYK